MTKQDIYLTKAYANTGQKANLTTNDHYVFILVNEQCTISFNENDITCPVGSLYVLRPDTSAAIICNGGIEDTFATALYIPLNTLGELSDSTVNFPGELSSIPAEGMSCCLYCSTFAIAKNLVENLNALQFVGYEYGRSIYVKGILSILLVYFVRAIRNESTIILKGGKSTISLEAVCAYISKHIAEDITLERLANVFFIDKSYLNRQFKKATGMTLHRYIIRAKLQLSQQYIVKGYPLSEIYNLVGIGGYNNFFRAFKREFGVTPSQYYRQWLHENHKSNSHP